MGPVRKRQDGHPGRRRNLLRYRESWRDALQWRMLPAAARLLQHDQQPVLVCGGDDSGRTAGVSDPASDRLWVSPANAFQSERCGFRFYRPGITAQHVLSVEAAHRLSVELDDRPP